MVKLWDLPTGSCVQTFRGHSYFVCSIAFSPDTLLVASGSGDNTVRIWDLRVGGMITTLRGYHSSVTGVKFSPDGKRVVSVSEYQEIILWDVAKWEKLAVLPSPVYKVVDSRVSFSVDGSLIVLEF